MITTDKYQLWPFVLLENGTWSIPDKLLQQIWESITRREKNEIVFYDVPVKTFEEWGKFLKTPANHCTFVVDAERKEFCFMAWLNNIHGHVADGHFIGITPYKPAMGKLVLKYWSQMGLPLLIIGIMPAWNSIAIRMALSL